MSTFRCDALQRVSTKTKPLSQPGSGHRFPSVRCSRYLVGFYYMSDLLLVRLDQARLILAKAKTIPEVKRLADMAAAAKLYAKRVGASSEAVNHAAEIKLRSERRLGEILQEMPKRDGARGKGKKVELQTGTPLLKEVGVSKKQSYIAQNLASIPEPKFEQTIAEVRDSGKEITTTAVLKDHLSAKRRSSRVEKINEISKGNKELKTEMRFPVIYCDPPWKYDYAETENRAIENQYPTMSIEEICALPFRDIATPDCVCFMWATSPKLEESIRVLFSWGLSYRTCAVWVKDKIGMGYYFRQQHELLLVATMGNPPVPDVANRVSSVIEAPRTKHSAKPERAYEIIEEMYPEFEKLEMFCRLPRKGWHAWGNQA